MSELEKVEKEILRLCGRDLEGDCNYRIHYKAVAELILKERHNKEKDDVHLL